MPMDKDIRSLFFADKKSFLFILFIILLAAILQFYKLTIYPVGFHVDEIRVGNAAWSILKTGRDFWGQRFPLYYDTFGDNRPTGLIYLTIPFVALFGLTEFAVRLPSAVFAIASVPAIMYCVYVLFRKKDVAILSGLILGTSPWLVILGRSTSESIVALFFVLVGFTYWVKASQTNRTSLLTRGIILASLSFLFYHSPRVFVPLFFGASIPVLFRKSKLLRTSLFHWISMLLVIGILVFIVPGGLGRIKQTAFMSGPEVTGTITRQLQEEGPNKILEARTFHNKGIVAITVFLQNYLRYFSGDFLFFTGGQPLRYNTEDFGVFFVALAPLLVLGLLFLREEKKSGALLLLWVGIAPVVAAATAGFQPNVQRGMFLLPGLSIVAALGFSVFLSWKKHVWRNIILILFAGWVVINAAQFIHQYENHRTGMQKNERDVNNTLLGKYIATNYKNTNKRLVIATRLVPTYEHVFFYTGFDPKAFQSLGDVRKKSMWSLAQYTFYEDFCPSIFSDKIGTDNAVYFDFAMCILPNNFKEVAVIADGHEDIYFRVRVPTLSPQ